jgi:glycosyltransferase involved in cell wall biosynthesis
MAENGQPEPAVAIVHDYLTQRGGAERVVLLMLRAFRGAPLYTSLYDPAATYPEFGDADLRLPRLNRLAVVRRHHRLALPLLARTFSTWDVEADVVLCSSSGWSHGVRTAGRKVVYCYNPARWLYQASLYTEGLGPVSRAALTALRPYLLRCDRRAARGVDRYLAISTAVRDRIRAAYAVDAEIVHAPYGVDPSGGQEAVDGLEPGYFLVISRLLRYKNVDAILDAFAELPERLVVVGVGPDERRLRAKAPRGVRFLSAISNEQLRWLYANAEALIAASYEDYGLTPLEAATFGRPSAVLRFGGFLDTVVESQTGVFFDAPEPHLIRAAIQRLRETPWEPEAIRAHTERFTREKFIDRIRQIVDEERSLR